MYRALIIDDEKPVRIAVSKLGQWPRFHIEPPFTAANGKEGLAAMREIHPHMVFVDMNMPIMDGTEFLKRASEEFPDVYYIVISGYDDFTYAQQAIRYGVMEYLLKPIVEEELNSTLMRIIRRIEPGFDPDGGETADVRNPDEIVEIIHDYIEKNYSRNIKLSMFADKYFFSREYLARQFKARYHCGIYEYVLQVRMARARELLLDESIKIQDVAQRVGYSDNNYFSKAFRTYYGESPTEFRQKYL